MDAIAYVYDTSWRTLPAALMSLLGALMLLRGGLGWRRGWALGARDIAKPLSIVSALRWMLVGTAVAAFGAGWQWQQPWLIALSLAFGAEELLETSIVASALKQQVRRQRRTGRIAG